MPDGPPGGAARTSPRCRWPHAAGDHPAGPEHARHLRDRASRVGEAVQAGERHDQVHRTVRERQGFHVGQPRLDLLGNPTRTRGRHGAVEHGLGDVGGEVLRRPAPAAVRAAPRHPRTGRRARPSPPAACRSRPRPRTGGRGRCPRPRAIPGRRPAGARPTSRRPWPTAGRRPRSARTAASSEEVGRAQRLRRGSRVSVTGVRSSAACGTVSSLVSAAMQFTLPGQRAPDAW